MKISRLIIPDFQQFKDFDLDLTYPERHERAGEPLDKVCFIGGNGTGKSTLLQGVYTQLSAPLNGAIPFWQKTAIKLKIDSNSYYWIPNAKMGLDASIEEGNSFRDVLNFLKHGLFVNSISNYLKDDVRAHFANQNAENERDFLIYCPSESQYNSYVNFNDVPPVSLDKSLSLFEKFPITNIVSNGTVEEFWKLLIYHLKKRENDFRTFESLPENQIKTVKEVRELFEKQHPDILKSLSDFWNKILAKAGLEFDYEGAKNPIQLTDNLQAYIRLKNSKEHIGYNQLSTGIRNFIFKLGHIFALYFNRNIESGFLLVDEPENSLFPDFLYGLVDTYVDTAKNTQIFMATHNPIIAAQFQPYERFILEFEEGTGHVKVRRGTTPVGDDPNDILIKDFGIRSILGREGVTKWERYIELKTLIPLEHDPAKKNSMIEEFMQIGSDYNFAADAVS
jgi:AAA15 family ATPase/GTPase|nr:ATP-binding protein [Saprospiraceae bacterium]